MSKSSGCHYQGLSGIPIVHHSITSGLGGYYCREDANTAARRKELMGHNRECARVRAKWEVYRLEANESRRTGEREWHTSLIDKKH